ncbi:MAG: hypothetical protein SGILL_001528, partial [Bacillariaceae sp.]
KRRNKDQRSQQHQNSLAMAEASPMLGGDAASAIFLLRDYSKFGLAERVSYHFDLTEALMENNETATVPTEVGADSATVITQSTEATTVTATSSNANEEKEEEDVFGWTRGSGMLRLLEFAPSVSWQRFTKRQKRSLRTKLRDFNNKAEQVQIQGKTLCYQPQDLPLKCNPSTRIYFGYEVTRIAFCVDASSSLTSTFGVMGRSGSWNRNKTPLCPLDRLPVMARKFFEALAEPVSTATMVEKWKPNLAVTVLAVYPTGEKSETSLLVRDFHVHDMESAKQLADHIEEWTYSEVESGIAERLTRRHAAHTWSIPIYSSSMSQILEAGDYALQILSSEARPVIVVATDGRSMSCEGIVDVFLDVDRVDVPVHVLDLSMSETHAMEDQSLLQDVANQNSKNEMNFLSYDPGGTMDFPLHLSDDSESLFFVVRATGGTFLDMHLLNEAAKSTAGQQALTDDPLQQSHSFKRRFAKMNGLQWLMLFSLSPISPTFHTIWGKLVPPLYLQRQLNQSISESASTTAAAVAPTVVIDALDVSRHQNPTGETSNKKHLSASRTTFSIYVVSPVRIKALLLMRIKEGYRAKQYGLSTHDPDKVFIQFTLSLEYGTVLHYELSYKALNSDDHMIGSAHIKIELSGDPSFVQLVKKDFLNQSLQMSDAKAFTLLQKRCLRLCQVIRTIRRDDELQSYLRPPRRWTDQTVSPDSPLAKRIGTMTDLQRKLHFQSSCFDVVTSGLVPYGVDDNFLAQFVSSEDGIQELLDAVSRWSTLTVKNAATFVKSIDRSDRQSSNYCVVEIMECVNASQLFTIKLEFFGGTDPKDRLGTIRSLKDAIEQLKNVEVLTKQMAPFIAGRTDQQSVKKNNVEIQFHHASWDLIMDPELLSLLTKRRIEIGGFRLLETIDDYALFAKLVPTGTNDASPDDLVQYQIAVLDDRVRIDLHMESEGGIFNPYREGSEEARQFRRMVNTIRRRDQECGRALRSRTNLLQNFISATSTERYDENHRSSVNRILAYSSRVTRRLRFFTSAGGANDILMQLTSELILSESSGEVKSERLDIASDEIIREQEPGIWFLQLYDRQTMSIVHLSLIDQVVRTDDTVHTFRDLTFFTNGVSDLYSKRDDLADDDSTDSHISEYMCVSEFADHFEIEQRRNFALAAYKAYRLETLSQGPVISMDDFSHALAGLQFVEVSSVLIAGASSDRENDESKLLQSIKTILQPVPGDSRHFYFCGQSHGSEPPEEHKSAEVSGASSVDTSSSAESSVEADPALASAQLGASSDSSLEDNNRQESIEPPIFVRFQIDNEVASIDALNNVSNSCELKATVSVYKTAGNDDYLLRDMSWSQKAFATEITALLKSYVAEQTLERLRGTRDMLAGENFRLIKKCMARIQSVVSFSIDVNFYISQRGTMMPAAAPAGGEAEVQEGFHILDGDITNNPNLVLTALEGNAYFVSSFRKGNLEEFRFWCLVSVRNGNGTISAQMYHPDGASAAMDSMKKLNAIFRSCIHSANQQLLLRRYVVSAGVNAYYCQDRVSSYAPEPPTNLVSENAPEDEEFHPGDFSCPVVFRTLFDLYQRAATNPTQVARTLEATVLHNFAVSNRSGIFVYKDESGAIFYMELQPRGSGIDADGQVELLVYGIDEPGPSVTDQLRVLLQRRLLLIAVDMLSSVLNKNPHFKWRHADIAFLRSFGAEWQKLDDKRSDDLSQYRYYKFPPMIDDPVMVLLFLRQNLCGSTYFHRLNDIDTNGHNPSPPITAPGIASSSNGVILKMNQHEFSLYYNNAPSKLEPAFQGLSTLTEKGAEYCRQTGTGIAMIEFTLVKADGGNIDEIEFAKSARESEDADRSPAGLRMEQLSYHS